MTVRLWSAQTGELQFASYLEYFNRRVLPELRGFKGYVGATVLSRPTGGQVEILVATLWRSLESVRDFAGPDIEAAVVSEEAAGLLAEYDRRVRHFDVATADLPGTTVGQG